MLQGLRKIHSIQKITNVSLIWVVSEISDERPHSYINAFNDALSEEKKLVYIIHLFASEVKQNFEDICFQVATSAVCKPRVF